MGTLNPKLIVFDWDDVITLGAKEGYFACYEVVLQTLGVSLPEEVKRERVLRRWGTTHREELRELLEDHTHLLDQAARVYEEAFFGDVFLNSLRVVEGTAETLRRLSQRYTLAVATGGHPQVIRERIMPRFGIPDVFARILSAYEISDPARKKPDPYMLNTIMEMLGMKNTDTVYVGDAYNDVRMAQNAGVEPVAVLTGHLSRTEAARLGVHHIIADITRLESILQIPPRGLQ
jgi:phosphoglycolate phosphatase-like HAD superfamily hydrolase